MQLKDYIKGNKHGRNANRLEREAMNDPFLRDAMDGFNSVAGEHAKIIEELEEKYTRSAIVHKPKKKSLYYWAAAASVLLIIGISTYFFRGIHEETAYDLAVNQIIENEEKIISDSFQSQSEDLAEFKSEPMIAEARAKEVAFESEKKAIASLKTESISTLSKEETPEKHYVEITDLADHKVIAEAPKTISFREQEKQIFQGKVIDETGEPIVGASIAIIGTFNGTVSGTDGTFTIKLPENDSSKLIASYLGYESQEINPLAMNQTVTLKEDTQVLSEVVVVGYGTQKRSVSTGSVSTVRAQSPFGEKEFLAWCKQKAGTNICEGKKTSVKVTFFIDETGEPTNFEYQKYSCEEAKKEMEKLLLSSPVWTKVNRKVTITFNW